MEQTKSDGVILVEHSDKNPLYDVCTKERLETLLNYSMHQTPYIPDLIKEALLQEKCARREIEKEIYNGMYQDVNLSHAAQNIDVPTLIVWGEKDRMTHIDDATLFHRTITNSQLIILKEIGHVPILEAPEKTADVIGRFIEETEQIRP